MDEYDAVVIGAGAAGLSAALVLGRAVRKVLVVDAGEPRNAASAHMHGFLSRDGASPAELLAIGREEVRAYGTRVMEDTVVRVRPRPDSCFDVELASGDEVTGRYVLAATGLVDELPDVPGLAERWGRDVLHCPYCHGWEVRGQAISVLATSPGIVAEALMLTRWTDDVTLLLHTVDPDDVPADDWERLRAVGVTVVTEPVECVVVEDDHITGVRLCDGRTVACAAVYIQPVLLPRDEVLRGAGAEVESTPLGDFVRVDADGHTSVEGLWAVGNVSTASEQVVMAAGNGYRTGVAMSSELIIADVDRAVARIAAG